MSNNNDIFPQPSLGGQMRYFRVETNDESQSSDNGGNEISASQMEFGLWVAELRQQFEEAIDKIEKLDWDLIFKSSLVTAFLIIILLLLKACFIDYPLNNLGYQYPFRLQNLFISEFEASESQITGKFNVTFNISNHGINDVYYEKAVVSVFLRNELLWATISEDFYLGVDDSALFNVSTNRTTTDVADVFVPTAFMRSRKMKQPCEFKVKYDAMIREGVGWWYGERDHVYVTCGWVMMNFRDDNTLVGGPAQCSVHI